jgi:hypothetical protein
LLRCRRIASERWLLVTNRKFGVHGETRHHVSHFSA